ncbi:MAG TPA: phosphotransferase [Acidimicrobiales bacterium]|nr:phosphotransferase [Acidimicrobiales bacterium]
MTEVVQDGQDRRTAGHNTAQAQRPRPAARIPARALLSRWSRRGRRLEEATQPWPDRVPTVLGLAQSVTESATISLRAATRSRAAAPVWWAVTARRRRRDRATLAQIVARFTLPLDAAGACPTGQATQSLDPPLDPPSRASLTVRAEPVKTMSSSPSLAVARLQAPAFAPAQVVIKVTRDAKAQAELGRDELARRRLRLDPRLAEWHHLVPQVLAYDNTETETFTVERHIGDADGRSLLAGPPATSRPAFRRAWDAITALHMRTRQARQVDDALYKEWVTEPSTLVASLYRPHSWQNRRLAVLQGRLGEALGSRLVEVSWAHGDYSPGNLLFSRTGELAGITDWGGATDQGSACFDTWLLALTTAMLRSHLDMGAVFPAFLAGVGARSIPVTTPGDGIDLAVSPPDPAALEDLAFSRAVRPRHRASMWRAGARAGAGAGLSTVETGLWLCWLRHLATNLLKAEDYRRRYSWRVANIDVLLSDLA